MEIINNYVCEICGSNHKVEKYTKTNQYLCSKHYAQIFRHGVFFKRTIYDKNEIILHENYAEVLTYTKQGEEYVKVKIDLEDVEKIKDYKIGCNYQKNKKRYNVRICVHGKTLSLWRFLLNITDSKIQVDHISRDTLDNRHSNFRLVNNQLNSFNTSKKKNNTSGFIGVSWLKSINKWRAYIMFNKKQINLGCHANKEDAIVVRLKAELKYFGAEFAPQRHLFDQYGIEINGGV